MLNGYHNTRLAYDQRRQTLWRTLCDAYFQKFIGPEACVLELGAGYGHFINNIRCARRIAVDQWAGMVEYLDRDVIPVVTSVTDLGAISDRSVDFIFASNVFEHLTQVEFAKALEQIRFKLKLEGSLNILQPNYYFAYREYYDDFTHVSAYSHRSLVDFLTAHGFRVIECVPRFLPLTVKSRFPVWPGLIRLYLRLPLKLCGKQMLVRAVGD